MGTWLRHGAGVFVLLLVFAAGGGGAAAQGHELAALRGAVAEMRAAGMTGPQLEQMEAMLRAFEADDRARGRSTDARMRGNRLREVDIPGADGCDIYWPDAQAYSFCEAAAVYYLAYVDAYRQHGDSAATLDIYAMHTDTVDNLVNYVENFMTRRLP